jgi:hypothetical protein
MALICELENTKTQESLNMDPKGTVFGRAGSNADVTLKDQAVSKRHAKVYASGGYWYLEDLGSSNGTYVDRDKIAAPVRLEQGMVFAVSRFKFRVARLENDTPDQGPAAGTITRAPTPPAKPAPAAKVVEDEPLFDENAEIAPPPEPSRPAEPAAPPARPAARPVAREALSAPSALPRPSMPSTLAQDMPDGEDMPDEPDVLDAKAGFAYFLKAIPKAIAYYVVAVPALAIAPWKTIPGGIQNQKLPAIDKLPLVAYVFPALLAASLVGTLASIIAVAISGSIGAAITGAITGIIVGIIASAIGAGVTGFFGHRILEWVIDKLQGQSDAKSRTNYLLMTLTAGIIIAVPGAIGTLITAINLPFVNALGPLVSVIGTLVSVFVTFSWMNYFRVHHIVPKVILGLGALAVIASLYGFVGAIITSVKRVMSSDGGASAPDDDASDDDAKDDDAKDDDAKDDDAKDDDAKDDDAKDDDAKDDAKKDDTKKDDTKKDDAKKDDTKAGKNPSMSFKQYADKAKTVDDRMNNDPSLIEKKAVRELYEKLSTARHEADKVFQQKVGKNPALELVYARERDLDLYRKTADLVTSLADAVK